MCKDGIHNIVKYGKINNIIDKIITQYLNDDLFELMWILDDLDRLTPQNTLEKILG